MKKKIYIINIFLIIILIIFALAISLFLIRTFSSKQLDDVSPEIQCDSKLLEKADILYIIPKYNNKSISNNTQWCNQISSLNKTLALHGFYHTYNEFGVNRNKEYLEEGIIEFKNCFNEKPEKFKPPQTSITKDNKFLIKNKMEFDSLPNQIFHKVYHCNDTGKFPNWFMDLF
jgi:hypothetical protein